MELIEKLKEKNVRFIQMWFTNIVGNAKSFSIPVDEFEDAINNGKGFDGSSIEGFTRIQESDMVAKPDIDTLQVFPWKDDNRVARVFCDIYNPDGTPYEGDPRYILKKNLKIAEDKGFTYYVGPEVEYFYFTSPKRTEVLDKGGYFDLTPPDIGDELRRKTIVALESMGIGVEYSHHEVGPSQHEIDLKYSEALRMADNVITYKYIVKKIAQQAGYFASFMPKPLFGENGSGMHTHQSLFKGDKNVFFSEEPPYYLSPLAKKFIAGLLHYSKEITFITNQWVNSYKRLVPGYEAPVYVSWACRNRSTLLRVPQYKPGKESATRIEYRSPDPAANPYFAFAVMLRAGLAGIENDFELPPPVEENIFEFTEEKLKKRNIELLPGSLIEAIKEAEKSKLIRDTLGEATFFKLLENKEKIWNKYRGLITSYEIENDLPVM
ncbi:MAG: glutamine synthetase [Candidatus Cloacimonas sp. 4484_209]|nr:MAG: glutamine synthetase [Candidatus Cloacimonas sp. 4484_209]